ncbi:MAG: SH3 domain-containing protein, partial [Flavobacteriaceae bacterium]
VLSVVLLWIFVGLFLGYLFSNTVALKRSFFFSSLIILLLFLGSFSITFSIDQENKNTHYAILFSPEIEIWSEPNPQGEFLFTLHEGTKFQLLDDLEDWQKIRIANGSEGWIRNAVFRKLD